MRTYQQELNDTYFTSPNVAKSLLQQLFEFVSINNFDIFVEPSVGNGAFYNALIDISPDSDKRFLNFDIDPKITNAEKIDFLTVDTSKYNLSNPDTILSYGNPPFGRSSDLVHAFIKKCSAFSNHIAMILPSSILTARKLKCVPEHFHPVFVVQIPGNPFLVDGEVYDKTLKTSFIYFQRLNYPRVTAEKILPNGNWRFLKKNDPEQRAIATFKIQQNGSKSGRCILSTDEDFVIKNKKSKIYTDFYILVDDQFKDKLNDIQTKLNNYKYTFSNLTTWKSLCGQRITAALNEIIC